MSSFLTISTFQMPLENGDNNPHIEDLVKALKELIKHLA